MIPSPPSFHVRCGQLVSLSNGNRTAVRTRATEEFNHGLILSSIPLADDQIFEIRIDTKVHSWSGSIEIGVTSCDPDLMDNPLPSSATELRNGSWIMSGNTILKDGRSINENYGRDLDKLEEGDRVGVLKTSQGDLIFFVNGVSQSVADVGLPERMFAVVDMYGKCVKVTLMDNSVQELRIIANDLANEATAAATNHDHVNQISTNSESNNITNSNIAAASAAAAAAAASASASTTTRVVNTSSFTSDKIRFHERKGILTKLSNNNRTCERVRPFDEFNNGVVLTHRPLRDDELFEIKIDRLVDKWSGSIEVGITTHNPNTLDIPATMTNQRSGTMMMSGCGILTNGKGTRRDYGDFNLDELVEGDRIGMMRKADGNLHFYINGLDQGVAATRVPTQMWGVVDLYGMTVKVTIVDRDERDEQNLITRRNVAATREPFPEENRLLFHPNCGSHASVINSGLTAHRPNACDDFNFGVVLTNRPLSVNEVFEVRLDKMVTKWAGSIEIGVTTHSPSELEFPSTMTNIRSGTWMMTGNGVMHNGTTVIDDYGLNLDKLKVGNRVAVVRKENGTIHFFVNSEDQGPAATDVPERVYGVIDLYGQAAQATIIDLSDYRSPEGSHIVLPSQQEIAYSQIFESDQILRFHHLHGRNARISNNGQTASRPNALGEFNDSIVISSRPLKDGEVFEIVIEKMVERWSGSIEAGVTLIRPEDLEFPNTMTDMDYDTWMLSGSAVMKDGQTVRNGYSCDLDSLSVGSRLGMMRALDGSLRYTINGEDQGVACESIPGNVYAVIDLYGQCAQVSLSHHQQHQHQQQQHQHQQQQQQENSFLGSSSCSQSLAASSEEVGHKFNPLRIGKGIVLHNNDTTAVLSPGFIHAILFGLHPLNMLDDTFEVQIDKVDSLYAGSLKIGVTSDDDDTSVSDISALNKETIWLHGNSVFHNGKLIKMNFCTSLDRLSERDRVGIRRFNDGSLRFTINGEDTAVAATNLPHIVTPVIELYGTTKSVTITTKSSCGNGFVVGGSCAALLQDSLEVVAEHEQENKRYLFENRSLSFHHDSHGRNIQLNGDTAIRTDSYNQGIVATNRVLTFDDLFQVTLKRVVDTLSSRWSSSFMIGVISTSPSKIHFPVSALALRKNAWIIWGDSVFQNGNKIAKIRVNLDELQTNRVVGIKLEPDYSLHLWIDGIDQGPVIQRLPSYNSYYGIFDLYGKCEEVKLLKPADIDEMKRNCNNVAMTLSTTSVASSISSEKAIHVLNHRQCEYFKLCKRFMVSMGLPKAYFNEDVTSCYCESCCKLQGYDLYVKRGEPIREYATPLGWVRFSLKRGIFSSGATSDWHVAFFATKPAHVRKILDRGNLVPLAELGLEQMKISTSKTKDDDNSDSSQFLFSPTINYISEICSSSRFEDKNSGCCYKAKVSFQVDVHPGSYKIGPPSVSVESNLDPRFKVEETEWLTKERGNTVITDILVRLEL